MPEPTVEPTQENKLSPDEPVQQGIKVEDAKGKDRDSSLVFGIKDNRPFCEPDPRDLDFLEEIYSRYSG